MADAGPLNGATKRRDTNGTGGGGKESYGNGNGFIKFSLVNEIESIRDTIQQ
jgi:hypothetical protein